MWTMTSESTLAPGVPADYYRAIYDVEEQHWWHIGMREIARTLLADRLKRPRSRLLDAGCGTGGFLRWAMEEGEFAAGAGIDLGAAAIELARQRVPDADLRVGSLRSLPFDDRSFDLVVTNDVLQHVPERELPESLRELRRVLAEDGALLVRTNGARRTYRERDDWRAFDRRSLRDALLTAGFAVERVTYANMILSVWAAARGRSPHAPNETAHGIPGRGGGALRTAVGSRLLRGEARLLARPDRTLPFGHTLFAMATPR